MDSLITYSVYNSIIILPIFFIFLKKHKALQNIVYYVVLCFIIILVSIRYQVGSDFYRYEYIYIGIQDNERVELGFQTLVNLLNLLGLPSQSLFLFSALIIYGLVFKTSKYLSSYIFIALWFLIFFLPSLNLLRQSISIAILTYAILYLEHKKRFILLVFLATSFHYTGAIGIVFLILSRIHIRFLWAMALFLPLLSIFKISDIILALGIFQDSYYLFYLTDQSVYAGQQSLSIGGVIRVLLVFLFIYIYRNDERVLIKFIKNALFSYCALYFLSLNFYILYRIYMPFMVALPFAACYLLKEKELGVKIFVFFYVFCLFLFFQKNISEQTISPSQGNSVYPYQTIFSEKIIKLD